MPTWAVFLIVILSAAAAGTIQTVCGFGAGVLLLLVLSQFFDMLTAPAVNLLVCVFLCLALAWKLRREIQFRLILIPLIPYLISSALINLVVDRIDLKVLGILFGAFQLLLCLYYLLIAKRIKGRSTTTAGLVCGFFSGITASLFGVGGPLLAVFLLGASRSKESYTANMQFVFLITNAIIFVNKLMKGLHPPAPPHHRRGRRGRAPGPVVRYAADEPAGRGPDEDHRLRVHRHLRLRDHPAIHFINEYANSAPGDGAPKNKHFSSKFHLVS